MRFLKQTLKYIRYYFSSGKLHDVHSPFVYDLLGKVIYSNSTFYAFEQIEDLRKSLLLNENKLQITDLGAGSKILNLNERKISDIAKHSAKQAKYGQLLFRFVNHFHPDTILELGTSLGISTLYLAMASQKSKVITIEGCPEIAAAAKNNFERAGAKNIEQVVGNFDDILPLILSKNPKCDFIFIDGNHRKEPTLKYFEQCLSVLSNDSIIIFDDIHWSDEMEQAWEQIKAYPSVTITLDLFFIGIVFFRKEKNKEHFTIRF